jgi:cytochrome c peroxidase
MVRPKARMREDSPIRGLTTFAFIGAICAATAATAQTDELQDQARELFEPLPSTIPAVSNNRITPEKVELGKALFFDPRLSASGVFSCASCHNLATGGDDNMPTSIGHGWQRGPRNSPTVLNSVLNEAQFWDGRAADLMEQAQGPIQAGVEMANTPDNVVAMTYDGNDDATSVNTTGLGGVDLLIGANP